MQTIQPFDIEQLRETVDLLLGLVQPTRLPKPLRDAQRTRRPCPMIDRIPIEIVRAMIEEPPVERGGDSDADCREQLAMTMNFRIIKKRKSERVYEIPDAQKELFEDAGMLVLVGPKGRSYWLPGCDNGPEDDAWVEYSLFLVAARVALQAASAKSSTVSEPSSAVT